MTQIKDKIRGELVKLVSDCTYTAEAHHRIANWSDRVDFWVRIVPAALTGLASAGEVVFQPETNILIILTFCLAVTTAVTNVIGAREKYNLHLSAAKKFTRLKKMAAKHLEVDVDYLPETEIKQVYEAFLVNYLDVVDEVPPTEEWAFEEARKRIQKDKVHEPD